MMRLALREAAAAFEKEEVPVGAIAVHEGRVIARAHNLRETLRDPTAHAEMLVLTQAAEALSNWRLDGASLYVTLEPCAMCAGALLQARVSRLVFGAPDAKAGACGSRLDLIRGSGMPFTVGVTTGVLEKDCAEILRAFFEKRRSKKK
ncbi:MAG: tRNA adenosine(34) deaminase TadA [Planctomycetota bacterium]|nr:tRNA adenosine(34) deaminase TadA [Planctomycetota bacterium]